MAETTNIVVLARELGIERRRLYAWRDAFAAGGTRPGNPPRRKAE
jgi:hypothetical protein